MPHARQQLREAVGTLLSAAPVNWTHVFETRIAPARDVLPYCLVFVEYEECQPITIHPSAVYERGMRLSTQVHVRIPPDLETFEDTLDAAGTELETTLTSAALNTQLSGKLKSLSLQSCSVDVVTDENERTFAVQSLEWQVQLSTIEGSPETLL